MKEAWRTYHDSFADNQQEVIDEIHRGFLKDIQHRTLIDLNGAVQVLKRLGEPEKAAEIIKLYLARSGWTRDSFDLKSHPFASMIDDPDVVQAIKDKYATFTDNRDPTAVMLGIANKRGWGDEDILVLSALTSEDYYTIFKEHEGVELRHIVDGCLLFERIGSSTDPMKEISRRAKEALRRIAQESPINALRVKKYGVDSES